MARRKKKLPKTITVRVPVGLDVFDDGRVETQTTEMTQLHELKKRDIEHAEQWLGDDGFNDATVTQVVWLEATIKLPTLPPKVQEVKAKVLKKKIKKIKKKAR